MRALLACLLLSLVAGPTAATARSWTEITVVQRVASPRSEAAPRRDSATRCLHHEARAAEPPDLAVASTPDTGRRVFRESRRYLQNCVLLC
ncbi:MAG: hypothetical protein AB2A00_39700 [Myxococcota bacterium]